MIRCDDGKMVPILSVVVILLDLRVEINSPGLLSVTPGV